MRVWPTHALSFFLRVPFTSINSYLFSSLVFLFFVSFFRVVFVVCMCVVISFILDVRFVDVPAGVTQTAGGRLYTGFLNHSSVVFAFKFLARSIQPFLSLVNHEGIVFIFL